MMPGTASHRLAPVARQVWPAAAVWALATLTVVLTSVATGYSPFASSTWARWDSGLYLDIAQHGYTLFRCAPPKGGDWCGNAGWFPAYPWLLHALTLVGLPLMATAAAVAWLFWAATIVLLRLTFLRGRLSTRTTACLAYAAFAPGIVFSYAIFPMSMLAFFLVVHLWTLSRGRWLAAGAAGAVAALAHPVGLMVIPASAIWLLWTSRGTALRTRARRIALVSGLSLAGPAAMVVVDIVETHHANAYLLVQAKYGHGVHEPFGPVINALHTVRGSSPFAVSTAPAVQTLVVALLLACVLAELVVHRRTASRTDLLIAIWASVTWIVPHMEANVTFTRSEQALALLAVLARRLPLPLVVGFLAIAVWLTVALTQLFLRGALV
jgi:hypothetical protein